MHMLEILWKTSYLIGLVEIFYPNLVLSESFIQLKVLENFYLTLSMMLILNIIVKTFICHLNNSI